MNSAEIVPELVQRRYRERKVNGWRDENESKEVTLRRVHYAFRHVALNF